MTEKAHWRVVAPASWPAPPAEMSVSTFADIAECPRRWALSAAEYPEVWKGRGYPPKLRVAALAGSVVHLALERITKRLTLAGVPSPSDPRAPQVLKELGGFSKVVGECVEDILKRYVENPRAEKVIEGARQTLRSQVETLRARVQSMLRNRRLPQGVLSAATSSMPTSGGLPPRLPLGKGTYPEVEVRAKDIGWKGKIDLLVLDDDACEITDFKTGEPDEAHKFQVRAYAVMWGLDGELNPSKRLVDRLVLAYAARDVTVPAPSSAEIDVLGRDLAARRKTAHEALSARPPEARPSKDSCRYCGVRQLCDPYWASDTLGVSENGRFGDVELRIKGPRGATRTNWDAVVVHARDSRPETPALLRLARQDDFAPGTLVRVLDGGLSRDAEDKAETLIVSLGFNSEVYRV